MIIVAKFASVCPCCSVRINVGSKVEWSKGAKAVHAACAGKSAPVASSPARSAGRTWDSTKFNGYGARRGGFRRACLTDGNCSSVGSGRACGGHDCDGH